MIAIKRLQSIMWILVVAFGALAAYLTSLSVATERNAVVALERQINHTRDRIRYLDGEFNARANMRQLEAWNRSDIRLTVPSAENYLADERALVALESIQPAGEAYVPPPVMTAMLSVATDSAASASRRNAEEDSFSFTAPARAAAPTLALTKAEAVPVSAVHAAVSAPDGRPTLASALALSSSVGGAAPGSKADRLALLDQTLLGDNLLHNLPEIEGGISSDVGD